MFITDYLVFIVVWRILFIITDRAMETVGVLSVCEDPLFRPVGDRCNSTGFTCQDELKQLDFFTIINKLGQHSTRCHFCNPGSTRSFWTVKTDLLQFYTGTQIIFVNRFACSFLYNCGISWNLIISANNFLLLLQNLLFCLPHDTSFYAF